MNEQMLFFQLLSRLMMREGIRVSFDYPPPEDRAFWNEVAAAREDADREALRDISACVCRNTDDYVCIEEIVYSLESRGFRTGLRHDAN